MDLASYVEISNKKENHLRKYAVHSKIPPPKTWLQSFYCLEESS
jgi:hypothetical protein